MIRVTATVQAVETPRPAEGRKGERPSATFGRPVRRPGAIGADTAVRTDEIETARFRAAVESGAAEVAHAMRGAVSELHGRLVKAGRGRRLRDRMPKLDGAMRDDMAAIVATARHRRGYADCADLTRAGYSEAVVVTFAPLIIATSTADLETVA